MLRSSQSQGNEAKVKTIKIRGKRYGTVCIWITRMVKDIDDITLDFLLDVYFSHEKFYLKMNHLRIFFFTHAHDEH